MFAITGRQAAVTTSDTEWHVIAAQAAKEIVSDSGSDDVMGGAATSLTLPDWFEFQRLVEQWHRERGATSSTTKIAMCPSYQRILADGQKYLPLILRKLEEEGDEPDHWFWALRVITGVDPVRDEDRGDIVQMSRSWLDWARANHAW